MGLRSGELPEPQIQNFNIMISNIKSTPLDEKQPHNGWSQCWHDTGLMVEFMVVLTSLLPFLTALVVLYWTLWDVLKPSSLQLNLSPLSS